jgi:hypothetical protein
VAGQYQFTASATVGTGMTVAAYDFTFGDGSTEFATTNTVSHAFAPGMYSTYVSVDFTGNGTTSLLTSMACQATITVSSSGGSNGGTITGGGGSGTGGPGAPPTGTGAAPSGNSCLALDVQPTGTDGQFTFTPWTTTAGGTTVTGYKYEFGDGTTDLTSQSIVTHSYAPGLYQASVEVNYTGPNGTATVISPACQTTVSVTHPAPGTVAPTPLRINAGGGPYTDAYGHVWQGDEYYSGGSADDQAVDDAIAGTIDPQLYQDERWGNFSYALPVANGRYTVSLHFAEIYSGCLGVGCRVFDVTANGQSWLTSYDVTAHSGGYAANVETTTVTVTNGMLDLDFTAVRGSAQLAALEILPAA